MLSERLAHLRMTRWDIPARLDLERARDAVCLAHLALSPPCFAHFTDSSFSRPRADEADRPRLPTKASARSFISISSSPSRRVPPCIARDCGGCGRLAIVLVPASSRPSARARLRSSAASTGCPCQFRTAPCTASRLVLRDRRGCRSRATRASVGRPHAGRLDKALVARTSGDEQKVSYGLGGSGRRLRAPSGGLLRPPG